MQHRPILSGSARAERPAELLALRRKLVGVLIPVAVFSAFVNLLGLSGSIYMLQVYDRVLPGYSKETLIVLTGLLVVLYLAMGLLDHLRASLLARAGARIQSLLDPRIFEISVSRPAQAEGRGNTVTAPQDIDALQRLMAGNAPVAVFDAPWLPVHVILLFYIHWLLGLLACGSALVLGGLAVANEFSARAGQDKLRQLTIRTSLTEQALRQDIDTLRALGMRGAARDRWLALRTQVQALQMRLTDAGGGYATASRTFRQLVQSLALGMGAWLAIEGLVSAGTIIACTILLGRALQPVDILIANWPSSCARARPIATSRPS